MPTVRISSPVVVSHPLTGQFVTLAKGMEFDENDPIYKTFRWAFDEPDEPTGPVTSVAIEQATAAPGERRRAVKRTAK